MKRMTVTDLVIELSATAKASEPKEVRVIAANSEGAEVFLRVTGVLEFKNTPGVVFIRAEAIGL